LHLRIAGLTISVTSADPAVRQQCIGPSARFVVENGGAPDLDLVLERVDSLSASDDKLLFDSGGVWRLLDDGTHYRLECQSYVFGDAPFKVALFDRSFTHGRLLLRRDVFEGDVDALQYPLDEVIVGHLLGRGRGVELHGCGIIHDRFLGSSVPGSSAGSPEEPEEPRNRGTRVGRLFVGQSEAGKTTTAGLWLARGGVEIVSDDRVVVREIDGEWRMFGTPWHGEAELSSPSSAPLAGVYLLQQATASRLVDVTPAEAAARLFGCAFPPFYDADSVAFTLELLDRLVANVPVRVLEFMRDASAIDAVLA